MKAFVSRLALFCLLLALLGFGLEGVTRWIDSPPTAAWKREMYRRVAARVEVLVLGSSHAENAVDPSVFHRPAFNWALPGQDLYYDTRVFAAMEPGAPRLRTVILCLDDFIFGYDVGRALRPHVAGYLDIGIPPRRPDLMVWLQHCSWFLNHRNTLVQDLRYTLEGRAVRMLLDPGMVPTREGAPLLMGSGFYYHPASADEGALQKSGINSAGIHYRRFYRDADRPWNRALLADFIRTARARGIRVMLVTTPAYRTYRAAVNPLMEAAFRQDLSSVLGETGSRGVLYRSYYSDRRFALGDFVDSDHLNAAGAAKFTRILEADLEAWEAAR